MRAFIKFLVSILEASLVFCCADTGKTKIEINNELILIRGGTFMMGSPITEMDRSKDEVQHRVLVSSFYMSKYEITQKEWQEVTGTTFRQQRDNVKVDESWTIKGEGDNYPMYYVSWYEVIEYCNLRSIKEGLTPAYIIDKNPNNFYGSDSDKVRWMVKWNKNAKGYRLPTEAEWEYACRAGTTTAFNTGDYLTPEQANYNSNVIGIDRREAKTVGSFAPNKWGLYDMHGNVGEWCWDLYDDDEDEDEYYYSSSPAKDPAGPYSGVGRVIRGGAWNIFASALRSAHRIHQSQFAQSSINGFRVVRRP